MKYKFDFQSQLSVERRKAEAARIREKYPDRIPVIVEVNHKDRATLDIGNKRKYLVPNDMTVGEFNYTLCKKRKDKDATKAIFMFTETKILAPTGELMQNMYRSEKNEDGFLYFILTGEETFGAN